MDTTHHLHAGIIFNPKSGRGRAQRLAEVLQAELLRAHYSVELVDAISFSSSERILTQLATFDLAVVVGGDGTLLHQLPGLVAAETPLYFCPAGNQSLAAQAFGTHPTAESLCAALHRSELRTHCVPSLNGKLFFTMASLGPDSQVVQSLAASRVGTASNWSYIVPIVNTALRHRPPTFSLKVDGQMVLERETGYLIVANSREYALGLSVVPEADSRQPTLIGRFLPYRGVPGFLRWIARTACNALDRYPEAQSFTGTRFEIDAEPSPIQADGEDFGQTPAVIEMTSRRLVVLQGPG